ncbi:hypothetical protein FSB78_07365 [Sphingomonas ginsenosidivorax]|uniref:Uncharacterized protein n=1 Tax=Sphingomonas ginsenosidivorax TaxID=862135 RepID=A0A5C6UFQ6_9SPHN|nr:hypothetical protein [Sphingomonas ginsenosidivorax]TXC70778.1 hypothetical protein FSB78_07365 [Sphingomonas ginsenosidivorax]
MASDETDRILAKIGRLLAEDTEYPLDGTLLHAEVDRNCVAPAIFKNRGNSIVFRWADLDRLGDALLDLWDAEEPKNRWAEIEYLIQGDSFQVAYNYKEDIDPDERPLARRDRIVKRYFGDKPIVYPPWPEDDDIPSYDL